MATLEKLTLSDPRLGALLAGQGTPFVCSAEWLGVLEAGLPNARVACYALTEGDRPAAALPGVLLKFGPVRMFYANLPYGGLVGDAARFGELYQALRPRLREEGVHEVRIVRTAFDAFDAPPGCDATEAAHHLLDLEALDFAGGPPYGYSVMRNVRRAEKSGVEVVAIDDPGRIDRLWDLYVATMKRNRQPATWPHGLLEVIYDRLVASGRADILFARLEGRDVAGIVLLKAPPVTFYFLGASDPAALGARPNDALFYEAIRRAADAGFTTFDFMTSPAADAGLMRFKEKWGATRRPLRIYRDELSALHARLWRWTQRLIGSRVGSAAVRWWQGHR